MVEKWWTEGRDRGVNNSSTGQSLLTRSDQAKEKYINPHM